MSNVTVIIPVHKFDDTVGKYLNDAIASVLGQLNTSPEILIVYSPRAVEGGILEFFRGLDPSRITSIKNEGKTDFCAQITFGAKSITTPYFSILEYDDVFSIHYFRNVEKHIKALPDVGIFLPITLDFDDKTNKPVQLVNQNIWSNGYVGENGELGYLNTKSLEQYAFYTLGGATIKTSEFLAVGGLKSNIVLTFSLEFILRFLNNGNKIYTLPKFGYKHIINREGSLYMTLGASLMEGEREFWFETAKKEAHFFNDRVIEREVPMDVV